MGLADIMKKSGVLAAFPVVSVTKQPGDPISRQRRKFCDGVRIQIAALSAELSGRQFVHIGLRKTKDSGEVEEKPIRLKKWWRKEGNRYLVVLRYGARTLFNEAIVAGSQVELHKVLEGIIETCMAGHFDKVLQSVNRVKRKKVS
ncbi:MAG: hypothetical protein WCO00_08240 [Rhodospirillaceae bacterium]